MAYTIAVVKTCDSCAGVGKRVVAQDEGGSPIWEDPCTGCGGDGKTTISHIDDTLLSDILDRCNDIMNKCEDILEQVSE